MNWGKGIVVAIILFVSFIMFFVIKMTTSKAYDHDLVTEDYYEKELKYQEKIDASLNAKNLGEKLAFDKTADGLIINFPKKLKGETLAGKVFLYRPSDKQLDFEVPFSNLQNYLLVPDNRLLGGPWNISIEFKHKNKNYFYSEEFIY